MGMYMGTSVGGCLGLVIPLISAGIPISTHIWIYYNS